MDPYQQQQTPSPGSGQPPVSPIPPPQPVQPVGGAAGNTTQPNTQKTRNPNSTQNSLLISEIRESMLIMNDGSFRAVVSCESINFDLMSAREKEGIEYSYQGFLNSLYFPIQIFVRSNRVDIGPYLEKLLQVRRDQDNMLLGVLMDDYIGFINAVANETNIMDKNFYVIIPYFSGGDLSALAAAGKSIFSAFTKQQEPQHIKIDQAAYAKAKDELTNRVSAVTAGLFQMGIKAKPLDTKQLSELYYNSYNPDTAVREPIGNPDQLTGTYVQKAAGPAPANQGGVL